MKTATLLCQLSVLSALTLSSNAQPVGDPLGSWFWRNPAPSGQELGGVVYGNGTYVAVGGSSIIFSSDGANWTSAFSDVFANLYAVTYGNNQFVAVGGVVTVSGTTDVIMTSPDGEFWTYHTTGASDLLLGVTYGNGMFVADGYFPNAGPQIGSVVTSTNGFDWAFSASITNTVLFATAFGATGPHPLVVGGGGGSFIAVGYDQDPPGAGQGTIYVSSDAVNWTNHPVVTGGYGLNGAAFGNGRFVAEGGSAIMTSTNGLDWSLVSPSGAANLYSVTYGNGLFVAGRDGGGFVTSSDGVNWTEQVSATDNFNEGVGYGGGQYVGVGVTRDGATGTILTSPDGVNWTDPLAASGAGSEYQLGAATFGTNQSGTGMFVAVGYKSPNPLSGIAVGPAAGILTSPDGAAWTARNADAPTFLNTVANGNGTFVAVGNYGYILTSLDGVNWTNTGINPSATNGSPETNGVFPQPISPHGPSLYAAAFGANRFVVAGDSGTLLNSADGFAWNAQSPGTSNTINSIAWNGSTFVGVGDAGTIITSPDGNTWTTQTSGTTDAFSGVTYGDGKFVAVATGRALTSPDGVTWTSHTADGGLRTVAWGGGEFVATAAAGQTVFSSLDGVAWTNRINYTGNDLFGVAYGQSSFVVVGSAGQILQSGSLATVGLAVPHMASSAGARMTITGKPGHVYSVQASSDLLKWTTVTNVAMRNPAAAFSDPSAREYSHRFYRVVSQ